MEFAALNSRFRGNDGPCNETCSFSSFRSQSVEGQHGAGDFAGFHRPERLVDVAEPAAFRNHRVEVEPALAEEVEIERDVGAEAV